MNNIHFHQSMPQSASPAYRVKNKTQSPTHLLDLPPELICDIFERNMGGHKGVALIQTANFAASHPYLSRALRGSKRLAKQYSHWSEQKHAAQIALVAAAPRERLGALAKHKEWVKPQDFEEFISMSSHLLMELDDNEVNLKGDELDILIALMDYGDILTESNLLKLLCIVGYGSIDLSTHKKPEESAAILSRELPCDRMSWLARLNPTTRSSIFARAEDHYGTAWTLLHHFDTSQFSSKELSILAKKIFQSEGEIEGDPYFLVIFDSICRVANRLSDDVFNQYCSHLINGGALRVWGSYAICHILTCGRRIDKNRETLLCRALMYEDADYKNTYFEEGYHLIEATNNLYGKMSAHAQGEILSLYLKIIASGKMHSTHDHMVMIQRLLTNWHLIDASVIATYHKNLKFLPSLSGDGFSTAERGDPSEIVRALLLHYQRELNIPLERRHTSINANVNLSTP